MMKPSFAPRIDAMQASAIDDIFKACNAPDIISFAGGIPAPEAFPVSEIREISDKILRENPVAVLQYNLTDGYTDLREYLKGYLSEKWKLSREKNEILITSGSQQAIDLITRTLCSVGDAVLCEEPSYVGALNVFRANDTNIVSVPVESDGISVSGLEKAIIDNPSAKLLYLVPNFHNPLGITLSVEKRKQVYNLAKKHGITVVEDDPYGEIYFSESSFPPIKSFDEEGVVVYCGSFSKIVSPGFRVGYLYGDPYILNKVSGLKQSTDFHTNVWSQMVLLEYLTKYPFEEHLAQLRELYNVKAGWMLSALDKYFPKEVKWTHPSGGMFLWVTLPDYIDTADFCRTSISKAKVAVVPGNAFSANQNEVSHSFRMNYSVSTKEEIDWGVSKLGELLETEINR